MITNNNSNANPNNRSSISNFSHSHQQQQQHIRQQQQQTNVNANNRQQQQQHHQQPINRPAQRLPASQQQHQNNHNQSNVNRPTQNGGSNGPNSQRPSTGQPAQPGQNNRPRPPQQQHPGTAQSNNPPTTANAPPQQPPPPQLLPKGWKREEILRTRGITSGLVDVVYGPTSAAQVNDGLKYRTKQQLQRAIGDKYDTALLDWRSGKLSQVALRKQRRVKSLAANPSNYVSAAKYDPYLCVPSRQTAGIFKQNVSYVTSGHRNEATPAHILNPTLLLNNPNSAAVVQQLTQNQIVALSKNLDRVKPTQLFWELRFGESKAIDAVANELEDINFNFELESIPKFKNLVLSDENVLRSVAVAWYLNQNKSLSGQDKEFAKNARIFIDHEQPLIPITSIKEEDIRKQEAKLKELRRKVCEAMYEYEGIDRTGVKKTKVEQVVTTAVETVKDETVKAEPEIVKKEEQVEESDDIEMKPEVASLESEVLSSEPPVTA